MHLGKRSTYLFESFVKNGHLEKWCWHVKAERFGLLNAKGSSHHVCVKLETFFCNVWAKHGDGPPFLPIVVKVWLVNLFRNFNIK